MNGQPKWTLGPWVMETVRTSCGTCHRIGPFPRPAYASKPEGWACVYDDYPPGIGSPDLLANARLISAAPDMADASPRVAEMLRVAATFIRSEQPKGTVFYDGAECDAFCIADDCEAAADDIDAALAKARGNSVSPTPTDVTASAARGEEG